MAETGYPADLGGQAMRLTRGTTVDESGSPLTGVTDPDAAAGTVGASRNFPGYLGFLHVFQTQYTGMPAGIATAAQRVFENIDALFSQGQGAWHPVAYQYDYGQFLRDVAVAAAARENKPTAGSGRAGTGAPRKSIPIPGTGGQPAPAPTQSTQLRR